MLQLQSDFTGVWVKHSMIKILEISVSDICILIGIIGYILKYRISVSDQKCDIGPSLSMTDHMFWYSDFHQTQLYIHFVWYTMGNHHFDKQCSDLGDNNFEQQCCDLDDPLSCGFHHRLLGNWSQATCSKTFYIINSWDMIHIAKASNRNWYMGPIFRAVVDLSLILLCNCKGVWGLTRS